MNQKKKTFLISSLIIAVCFLVITILSIFVYKMVINQKETTSMHEIVKIEIIDYDTNYEKIDIVSVNSYSADYNTHYLLSDREELIENIENNDKYVYNANFLIKVVFDDGIYYYIEPDNQQNILYGECNVYEFFKIEKDSQGYYISSSSNKLSDSVDYSNRINRDLLNQMEKIKEGT